MVFWYNICLDKENQAEVKMKATFYISVLVALLAGSCTASRFNQGGEYDDLYYSKSDKQAVNKNVASKETNSNTSNEIYYDNIYSGDTLIADGYNDAVDFDGSMFYNKESSPFEYADDYSYSNQIRRFYGNYFDPYWRDPFYYGYGGYSPYYDPYGYSPYYGYGGFNMSLSFGFGYGYGYGGYYPYYGYGGYYPYYGYGGYYPGYGYGGYYPPYNGEDYTPPAMGRRQTYSTLTSNYSNVTPSRKSAYQSAEGVSGEQRRTAASSSQNGSNDARRGSSVQGNSRQGTTSEMRNGETYQNVRKEGSVSGNSPGSRPEYNSQNRSYTPSYNNPRMTERPSYNNSRVSENNNQSGNSVSNRAGSNPGSNYGRSVSDGAGLGRMRNAEGNTNRTISNTSSQGNSMVRYPSSSSYTVPSSSRSEGSSSRSNSYNSSGSSGSSGYSGGSSSGGSGGGNSGRSSGGGSGTRR
jgi:hypothetical protein